MAHDIFLKFEGIKGESADHKHKDEIEVMSWSWGMSQALSSVGSGHGSGKADFQDIHFTKPMDSSSTVLQLQCATGAHIKSGLLTMRKAGGKQEEFLKIKMEDILVSGYQTGASDGSGKPIDQVSVRMSKIYIDYCPQKEDGSLGAPIKFAYDIKANVKA